MRRARGGDGVGKVGGSSVVVMEEGGGGGEEGGRGAGVEEREGEELGRVAELPFDRDPSYTPPPLVRSRVDASEVFSVFTWTGALDRFELVKTLRQAVGKSGDGELSVEEIEEVVGLMEGAEECACVGDVKGVVCRLEHVVSRVPNFSLALYRLGAALLVWERSAKREDFSERAVGAFRCALACEPDHPTLAQLVDLHLRVAAGVPVAHELWHPSSYPKSSGDTHLLASLALSHPEAQEAIREAERARREAAAKKRVGKKVGVEVAEKGDE